MLDPTMHAELLNPDNPDEMPLYDKWGDPFEMLSEMGKRFEPGRYVLNVTYTLNGTETDITVELVLSDIGFEIWHTPWDPTYPIMSGEWDSVDEPGQTT